MRMNKMRKHTLYLPILIILTLTFTLFCVPKTNAQVFPLNPVDYLFTTPPIYPIIGQYPVGTGVVNPFQVVNPLTNPAVNSLYPNSIYNASPLGAAPVIPGQYTANAAAGFYSIEATACSCNL